MNPNTPFYIDRHPSELLLDGEWSFTYIDDGCDEPWTLDYSHRAILPASAYRCLERAGILPDPYFGTNSKLYEWVDKKIWYFTRNFTLENKDGHDVFLCFDGVGYFCRVWLNGTLLCAHEGMFGGPIMEVSEHIRTGENTLIVEVTPPAPDHNLNPLHDDRARTQIVPWNLRRDASTSNGDFIVFGIWRSIRLEIVPKTHISRPYLFTRSIEGNVAKLRLSVEIADPQISELDSVPNDLARNYGYSFAYDQGLDAVSTGKKVRVKTIINEKNSGNTAYISDNVVDILNKKCICSKSKYH